ncbi:MAG: TIGR02186 family protein [Alphaproteobacteria bacterium]
MKKYLFICLVLFFSFSGEVFAEPISDEGLSLGFFDDMIPIHSTFHGKHVTLFGGVQKNTDIIAVLKGPPTRKTVRKKKRMMGIWVNQDTLEFGNVPSFYWLASTQPLAEILPEAARKEFEIDPQFVHFSIKQYQTEDGWREFKTALIQDQTARGLFYKSPTDEAWLSKLSLLSPLTFIGEHLFKAVIELPSNIKPGIYAMDVYLVQNQKITAQKTITLQIEKTGLSRIIYQFATEHKVSYGAFVVLFCALFGWLSTKLFRKE